MRKIVFGGANSLDNFIAGPNGEIDWLRWNNEVSQIISAFWQTIDTVLMGRKTYEVAQQQGGANSYAGVRSYVFSRTLAPRVEGGLEIVTSDAVTFIQHLKAQPGKEICVMGGGNFAQSLLEAGLIDEIGCNIHPVLLGAGVPLFLPLQQRIDLALIECRQLQNSCVYLRYRVEK